MIGKHAGDVKTAGCCFWRPQNPCDHTASLSPRFTMRWLHRRSQPMGKLKSAPMFPLVAVRYATSSRDPFRMQT